MIEQRAKVVACDEQTIVLEVERQSTCTQCQLKQGCGTGLLANHVGKRFSRITINKVAEVSPGQSVQIGIPEEALLQGVALMYLLPLVCMFIFSALAVWLNFSSMVEIFLGLGGLCIGFFLAGLRLRTKQNSFNAKILEERI